MDLFLSIIYVRKGVDLGSNESYVILQLPSNADILCVSKLKVRSYAFRFNEVYYRMHDLLNNQTSSKEFDPVL